MKRTSQDRSWIERIDELAREHPDAAALLVTGKEGETFSWRDLACRSAGLAKVFAQRGVAQGSTVCICLPNSVAFVLAALAAWRLGATVAPLRWDLPAPERAELLELAQPVLVISLTEDGRSDVTLAEVEATVPVDPACLAPAPIASPAWMTASGGSTGSPKLIAPKIDTALDKGGMSFTSGQSHFADNSDHRHPVHIVCTPLYHMHGFTLLFRTLVEDFRIVLMPRFDAEEFLDLVEREGAAFFALVPTIVVRLLKSERFRSCDFSSVENVILGAGATPDWAVREIVEAIGGEKIRIGYGMSESIVASFIRGDEWLRHPGSVGKPIGAETLVAGDDGEPLPVGEVGELYFRPLEGGQTFEYVGKAKARTLPGGWVSVGDLGKVDKEGYLYIADRRTDMVKTGGANVFVSEVEAALLSHPDVADVAVVGVPDPEWTRRVHAITVLRSGKEPDGMEEALREYCKQQLAAYKAPRSFEFVKDLGRNEAGKLNRQALANARGKENV